jgi:hypothetical protein
MKQTQHIQRPLLISTLLLLLAMPSWAGPLETAKSLADHEYKNWTYGTDASKKQIDCDRFVAAVVSKEIKRDLSADERNAILVAPAPADLAKAVTGGEAITKGVQRSLVDLIKKGTAVTPENAAAGDFIQYWMKKADGTWMGHSALISSVTHAANQPPRAVLYGAHESLGKIGEQDFGVGGLKLTGSDRYIYIARLSP